MRGIEALRQGLIWRVGDGTLIDIWMDPWLPYGTSRRPITPRGHTVLRRVSELIDPATGDWDKELIEDKIDNISWPFHWSKMLRTCWLGIMIKRESSR